ncbi:ABC transporter permease [Streptomyces sp. NPDC058401]|uniref:ABC transporter permease n=1 Tax=Streptomyces sp. NPDC058401 TaxID=3346480 RepID=UPI003647E788
MTAPASVRPLRVLATAARAQVLAVAGNPVTLLTSIAQPVVFYVLVAARHPADSGDRAALLVATLLTSLWGATLWTGGGTLRREIAEGTLARTLTSTTDPRLVVLGKCLGGTLLILAGLLTTGTGLALADGITVPARALPALLLGSALVAVSGMAMGYVLASVFVLTRHAVHVTAALTYPVMIVSGLLIPVSLLPEPLPWFSLGISLYWANRFLAAAAGGADPPLWTLVPLVLLTVVYQLAGHLLFSRVVERARADGTVDRE